MMLCAICFSASLACFGLAPVWRLAITTNPRYCQIFMASAVVPSIGNCDKGRYAAGAEVREACRLAREPSPGELCRQPLSRLAAWNPSQVSTQEVNGKRGSHKYCANPEAPVTMHAPPVRTRIGFASIAAISLTIVPVSGH